MVDTIFYDASGVPKRALAAGALAIGKLAANSGVDIGDVDILSIAAGDNRIGTVSGVEKEVRVTTVVDAADGNYAVNDVVSADNCICTSATKYITFAAVARVAGGYGEIKGLTVTDETVSITPRFTYFFFNAAPTSSLTDNLPNTGPSQADEAKYIGKIDVMALESLGTTPSTATVTPSTVGNAPLSFKCAVGSTAIYAIRVTRDIYTPVAGEEIHDVLLVEQY